MNKLILVSAIISFASSVFATNSHVARTTSPSLLGLSTYSPTSSSIAPFYEDNGDSYFFEAHDVDKKICYDTFFGDCHHQKNILGDIIKVNKNGKISRVLNDWFASGQQPSVAAIGQGYFVIVTTTQDAHALQGYVVQIVEKKHHFQIKKIASVNLGRGVNPSVASMGNGYFMVTSSNDNNITGEHFLAAYVFKATESQIYTPEYMNTYADGSLADIEFLGDGQFLETNNTEDGIEYNILNANDDKIDATKLEVISDYANAQSQKYSSVKLTPMNQIGINGNKQFLQVYSISNQNGMFSRVLELSTGNQISASSPYQFSASGEYPVAVSFQGDQYLEVNINQIIGSETGLYASILK